MKKQDPSVDLFDLKYHLHSGYLPLSEEGMLELYGKLSDIRQTTKDKLFLATYVCPPYTVSLGIFRQNFSFWTLIKFPQEVVVLVKG